MSNNKSYSNRPIVNSVYAVSLLVISIFIANKTALETYKNIWMLPFTYMICALFLFPESRKNSDLILLKITKTVMFIRFVLVPLLIAVQGNFYATYQNVYIYTSDESIKKAITYMCIELIIVALVLRLSFRANRGSKKLESNKIQFKKKYVLRFICSLYLPIFLVEVYSNIMGKPYVYSNLVANIDIFGILDQLISIMKPILFIVSLEFAQSVKNHKKRVNLASVIIIPLFIVSYLNSTRWEILFSVIISLFILKKHFILKKSILVVASCIFLLSFFAQSLDKFSWAVKNSDSPIRDVTVEMGYMFQDYFGGPVHIANSIEMTSRFEGTITSQTFINDFKGSIPLINKRTDLLDRTNSYFNQYNNRPIGHTTLIIPLLGVGYVYLGSFAFSLSAFCYFLVKKFDYRIAQSSSLAVDYIFLYPGLYLSLSMTFNSQIIFTTLILRFLPLYIILKFQNKG